MHTVDAAAALLLRMRAHEREAECDVARAATAKAAATGTASAAARASACESARVAKRLLTVAEKHLLAAHRALPADEETSAQLRETAARIDALEQLEGRLRLDDGEDGDGVDGDDGGRAGDGAPSGGPRWLFSRADSLAASTVSQARLGQPRFGKAGALVAFRTEGVELPDMPGCFCVVC